MESSLAPFIKTTPSLTRVCFRVAAISESMPGRISGSSSTTVTLQSRAAYRAAISIPITPPPTMTIEAGGLGRESAPVLSITPGRSAPGKFSLTGTEPLATIITSAVRPSSLSPWTFTVPTPATSPTPLCTATPLALSSPPTPPTRRRTTLCLRFSSAGQSSVTESPFRPIRSPCFTMRYNSEVCNSALVGMQPTFRQVPPRFSFSTRCVSAPS